MKSNKNFQKSKKSKSFEGNEEVKVKKVGLSSKKKKNLKKEIFNEIDEFEEIDLFGYKEEDFNIDDDFDDEE